jgi:hypothetical protein
MQRTIIASAILLATVLGAQAADTQHHVRTPRSTDGVVTYNRDSSDPNVGWHWEHGMRVCHQDCDNPEIPGSGYTCRNVQAFGMAMRECDSGN